MDFIRFLRAYRDEDEFYYEGDAINRVYININAIMAVEYDVKGDVAIVHAASFKEPLYITGETFRTLMEVAEFGKGQEENDGADK